jgi:hypothetical protein
VGLVFLQLSSGQVQGTIRDKSTKQGVARANLTFTRQGKDPKTATADDSGVYSTAVFAGSNAVVITKTGGINVLPDQVNAFDFEFEPGGAAGLPEWIWLALAALGAVLIGSGALEKD